MTHTIAPDLDFQARSYRRGSANGVARAALGLIGALLRRRGGAADPAAAAERLLAQRQRGDEARRRVDTLLGRVAL